MHETRTTQTLKVTINFREIGILQKNRYRSGFHRTRIDIVFEWIMLMKNAIQKVPLVPTKFFAHIALSPRILVLSVQGEEVTSPSQWIIIIIHYLTISL
jgi:hypothetical protein